MSRGLHTHARASAAVAVLALLCFVLVGAVSDPHDAPTSQLVETNTARFAWVDAYIDPKGVPLAAYQFELKSQQPAVTLVGVEGGEHPAFAEPPYYDPQANLQNRIVIAAFNTGDHLPRQRTRVARVMVRLTGAAPVDYSATLDVAASADGKRIDADITVSQGATP